MDKFFVSAKRFLVEMRDIFHEVGHDVVYDLRDNAATGFGLPRLISSMAALSVAGVAAAGTASISMDLVSKVFGKRECKTCNGWEGLRCTMCGGSGRVQCSVPGLIYNGNVTAPGMESTSSSAQTEISHFPSYYNIGLPLPWKDCPTCDATGVMKCTECKGVAWKGKFSLDNIMNVPWKVWDVYQKTEPPTEHIDEEIEDPATAAFWMFARPELEGGFKYDDDVKLKMMWKYKQARQYKEIRDTIAKRKPGWEELQKVLQSVDPVRAMQDPVIVKDIPYYKAMRQIKDEVEKLEVPPRPAEWREKYELPLRQSVWTERRFKDLAKMEEVNAFLEGQDEWVDNFFDTAWEIKWRRKKFEEIAQEKIQPYIEAQKGSTLMKEGDNMPVATETTLESAQSQAASRQTREEKVASAPQKTDKKQSAEEKKKRERQERAERLSKQAAEREAALAKAKAESATS